MSKLEIIKYPDPLLKQVCSEVVSFDNELATLLDDMHETMYSANGIGLAAPQIGKLIRATVIDISSEGNQVRDFINPTVTGRNGSIPSEEGCLSIPDYRDVIKRSARITVKAYDRTGAPFELEAEGLLAVCIQHEIDHLDGVLFIDHLSRLKREFFRRWFKKQQNIEE